MPDHPGTTSPFLCFIAFQAVQNNTDKYDIINAQHHFKDDKDKETDDTFAGKQVFHIA